MSGGMPLTVVGKPGTEICWGAGGNQESCFVHIKFKILNTQKWWPNSYHHISSCL